VLPMMVFVVLIVLNVGLLYLLFRPDQALTAEPADQDRGAGTLPAPKSSPTMMPSSSALPEQTTSPSPSASKGATSSTQSIEPAPAQRLLFAVSSKTAWRATVGDCDTPGKVERSTDAGASWKLIDRTGLTPIVRLGAEPSGDLFTIGGSSRSCSARYLAYANDGKITASTNDPIDVWFPTPKDRDEINGPGETKATPCKGHAVGFAPRSLSRALVICADGATMSTRNSGKTWQQIGQIPNALAIASAGGQYWVAGASEDCDGVTVQSLTESSGSLTRGRARCSPGLDVAAGQVAIDVTGDTIWLWLGDKVAVSKNNGRTWE
jgi:hypothetical protein